MRISLFNILLISTIIFVIFGGAFLYYQQTTKFREHTHVIDALKKEVACLNQNKTCIPPSCANQRKNWSLVQNEVTNSVVQIFSEIAEFNWLEPYKAPTEVLSSGSGFFINDRGDLITNAHVVDQAKAVSIQLSCFGKRRFDIDVMGVSVDHDLALLHLPERSVAEIKKVLGKLPYLNFGNSDQIHRSDEIMALGYPLGQQALKSTTGIVSGREHIGGTYMVQISAPINPGSSGGPSINFAGDVIGVNTANIPSAQNVGYIIPSNEVKLFLDHLNHLPATEKIKFLRKPYLGILFNPASDSLTSFLGNPQPGGLYVAGTHKRSALEESGIRAGDMIYEIDGYRLDIFGEMSVPWSEDKISVIDYIARLTLGDKISLLVYRSGKPHRLSVTFKESTLAPIRQMYPGYEKIDYEMIGGIVIMPLALNHLPLLVAIDPELTKYLELSNQNEGALIITHVLTTSFAAHMRSIGIGAVIKEVNGIAVKTMQELRDAIRKSLITQFLTIKTSRNIFAALPLKSILEDEPRLAASYFYTMSPFVKELIETSKAHTPHKDETQKKA